MLSLAAGGDSVEGPGGVTPVKTELQRQAEHVVDVLRAEVEGLTIQLQQAKQSAAEREAAASKQLDTVQGALRAAEIERDDLHVQYLEAMKQTEALLEVKLQLQVCSVEIDRDCLLCWPATGGLSVLC